MMEIAIAIATTAYVTVATYQLKAMNKTLKETKRAAKAAQEAADAAQRQVVTMQKQLEMSERPWITIQFTISGPLTFDNEMANLRLQYTLKNVGHSVAKNINIEARAFLQSFKEGKFFVALEHQKVTCDRALARTDEERSHGLTLFPNEEAVSNLTVAINKEEIDATLVPFPNTSDKYIAPGFVGCVTYEFPFPSESQTASDRVCLHSEPRRFYPAIWWAGYSSE